MWRHEIVKRNKIVKAASLILATFLAVIGLSACGGGGGGGVRPSGPGDEVVITPPGNQSDLAVVSPSVSDSSPDAGASFTLSATVRNAGAGRSAATTLRYYRSSDATISTSDTAVGTDAVGGLAGSGTSAESIRVTAPSTAGTYYYGACVDTVSGESDTSNNCSSAVRVTVSAGSTFGAGSALPGVPTSGSFIPARLSGGVRLSSSGGTTTITFGNGGVIELQDGAVYTCRAAGGCQVINGRVTRGTIVRGGGTSPPPDNQPDLAVVSPSVSDSSPDAGASFTLSATMRNGGSGGSVATTLRYYRSSDATISTSDTAVGTDAVGGLAASGTSAESTSVTAPSTAGTYYYGACVDTVSGESNTANNCSSAVRVTVPPPVSQPDLTLGTPSVSDSSPDAGASFTLSVTVRNAGAGRSAATTLRYYRSTDAAISTTDTAVGTDAVGGLAASGNSAESTSVTAPSGAGTYYYGACVDAASGESSAQNNCSSGVPVTVSAVGGGDSFGVGAALPGVPSSGTFIPARLSGGASLSSSGGTTTVTFGNGGVMQLQDGTVYTCRTSGGCRVTNGVVTRGAVVRSGGVLPPVSQPDLTVETLSVSDRSPDAGASVTLRATVRNAGAARSAATTLRYYRSSDATISTSDTALDTDAVSAHTASGTSVRSTSVTAPSTAGTYYYGACVDTVAGESDTTNNCSSAVRVVVLTSLPRLDLAAKPPLVDNTTPGAGELFRLTGGVTNVGSDPTPGPTLRFYRSTDSTISASDTEVRVFHFWAVTPPAGVIPPGGGRSYGFSERAPSVPGTYYYGVCNDPVSGESNTSNNCSSAVRVTVSPLGSQPDMAVESFWVSYRRLNAGASFTLHASVHNASAARSAATTLRYYRSSDATISTSDTAVGTDAVGGLAASGSSAESISVTAPSTAGTYYYGACVDTVSGESNTSNNCSHSVSVTVRSLANHPDLIVESLSVSNANPQSGASISLSATVRNQGGVRSAATTLRYYSSGGPSGGPPWRDTDAVSALDASGTSDESIASNAPVESDVGRYSHSYWACVDFVPGESDESNNCSDHVNITVHVEATGSGTDCFVGLLVRRGESCTYPGTSTEFSVTSSGSGRFLFALGSQRLDFTNTTVNGQLYIFVASNQGGGVWRIDRVGS